jgi:hypothetical protein
MKSGKTGVSRREFIRRTAQGAATLAAIPAAAKAAGAVSEAGATGPKPSGPADGMSRVVVVRHDDAYHDDAFDAGVVATMMDAGITRLTDIQDVGEAWKSLFPGITAASVIGIKINCLFQHHTHAEVTDAVIAGLKRMPVDGSPFAENNIIVWDENDYNLHATGGYSINRSATGVRYTGTSAFGSTIYAIDGGSPQRLSRILTDQIQFLVNLNVMKNHSTGVSLSMKNHYGSISNVGGPGMHDYPCPTQLSSLNALPPIRSKQVICICDAILAVVSNGPDGAPTQAPKRLILSRDTVAHDYIGAQILKDHGCRTTSLTGLASHIAKAAEAPYSLGTCDPGRIERIDVENPVSAVEHGDPGVPDGFSLSPNYPNPFNSGTIVRYRLDRPARVRARVVDAAGKTVRRLADRTEGPGSFQAVWDGKRADGSDLPSGPYILEMTAGAVRRSVKMQLVR